VTAPQAGTSEVLRTLLANSVMLSTTATPASILKSTDQLYEVVNLAHELLPPLTDAAKASCSLPARCLVHVRAPALPLCAPKLEQPWASQPLVAPVLVWGGGRARVRGGEPRAPSEPIEPH
jgi:hypothetical protein